MGIKEIHVLDYGNNYECERYSFRTKDLIVWTDSICEITSLVKTFLEGNSTEYKIRLKEESTIIHDLYNRLKLFLTPDEFKLFSFLDENKIVNSNERKVLWDDINILINKVTRLENENNGLRLMCDTPTLDEEGK